MMHILFYTFLPFISVSAAGIFSFTGNEITMATQEVILPSNIYLPFTDTLYDKLYISTDGLVGFDPSIKYKKKDYSSSLSHLDPAFIAPYHYNGWDKPGTKPSGCGELGQILYKTGPGQSPSSVTPAEVMEYDNLVRKSFAGARQYTTKWALVVSWLEVFSGEYFYYSKCQTNTFQLALLTDGEMSFAIFNFDQINIWDSDFVQVGFNADRGRGYTSVVQKSVIDDDDVGKLIAGKYLFRIDKRDIVRGSGCTEHADHSLKVYPETVGMLGGQMLDVHGPCFTGDNPTIKCRFGQDDNYVTHGFKVDDSNVRCSVPILTFRGRVKFEISIDFKAYLKPTTILVALENKMNDKLSLPYNGKHYGWNETDTRQLTVNWDRQKLSNDPSARVQIDLIGYREADHEIEWATLYDVGKTYVHNNTFTFDTSKKMCGSTFCTDYDIGLVKVELIPDDRLRANTHRYQITETMLGFYDNKEMIAKYGTDWPSQKCESWYEAEKERMDWLRVLPSCPCTLQQALVDIGRWYTQAGCNIYAGSKCEHHNTAVHCVKSLHPTEDGAGNQCCYDKSGYLMFAADSHQGSTSDRSNEAGTYPFRKPKFVPSLAHWVEDLSPYYYCCLWSDYHHCDKYMELRPTVDCTAYKPPTPGMVFGQGHIRTFDGASHRICTAGDFTLLKIKEENSELVTVQGRFTRDMVPFSGITNNSVALTNLAVRVGLDHVELRLRPPLLGRQFSHLEVVVSDRYYYFNEKARSWQDFNKFSIINSDTLRPDHSGNFTIILTNGLGIQIAATNNTMTVLFMMPSSLQGYVSGLLGDFNGIKDDDLGGMSVDSDVEVLYQMFQYNWAVTEKSESIMPVHIEPSYNSSTCTARIPQNGPLFCLGNSECIFDFESTGSQNMANTTLRTLGRMKELILFSRKVRTCGHLGIPDAIQSSTEYTLGSKVTVQGCKNGLEINGPATYTCTATDEYTQSWNPSVSAICEDVKTESDPLVIVAVVIGILVLIILIIALIIFIKKYRSMSNRRENYVMTSTDDNEKS